MTALAIRLLQSPDVVPAEAVAVLQAGPAEDPDGWLLLLGVLLWQCPSLITSDVIEHVERLIAQPDLDAEALAAASQALSASVPFSASAVASATRLISAPGLPDERKTIALEALRNAVFWAIELLDIERLLAAAEGGAEAFRTALLWDVIEPRLMAEDAPLNSFIDRAARLYPDERTREHFLYWLRGKSRMDPASGAFERHTAVAERLRCGPRRALIVHNINDGQGDEIARSAPLMQALLDFNLELKIVIVTRRLHLYSHPRVATIPIGNRARVLESLAAPFDAVIDFYEPEIHEVAYDLALERTLEELRERQRPFLDIRSRKGFNHFLFEIVRLHGEQVAGQLRLNRRRIANNYEPALRLMADLGLPTRRGEQHLDSEFVLAGRPWQEAEEFWNGMACGARMALLAPFGGAERLKGFTDPEAISAEILRLIREGFRVIVMPTGASWGAPGAAQDAIARLPEDTRSAAVIGPVADSEETGIPRDPALSTADSVMRLTLYGIQRADLIVTVEGWMAHAAHSFGKPYRILMLPYSHGPEWLPYGRSTRQVPVLTARAAAPCVEAPLVEQPRKRALLFVFAQLRNRPAEGVLPVIRGALASEDRDIRLAAAEALETHPAPEAAPALAQLLRDPSHRVRAVAARGLLERCVIPPGVQEPELLAHVWIGPPDRDWGRILHLRNAARPAIETAAKGDDAVVRREAAHLLRLLEFKPETKESRTAKLVRRLGLSSRPSLRLPTILILTPVKDGAAFVPGYYKRITRLSYPANRISIGFLESDSRDGTYQELKDRLPRLRKHFRRAELWKKDFGFCIPQGTSRWAEHIQPDRRAVLAKSRNHLLFRALDDEEWVLWLDVDVIDFPADIIEKLLATGKDIVQPHCVLEPAGLTFDQNAWRDHGRLLMQDMRHEGDLVELEAVGGTMLLVRADLHREGLIFPPVPYGKPSPLARERGELETEGLGILAHDMGYRCWGMPHLEIRHAKW